MEQLDVQAAQSGDTTLQGAEDEIFYLVNRMDIDTMSSN